MASNYPTSLDTFTNPSAGASLSSPSHSTQHGDVNDAVEAIEAKVGIGSSAASAAGNGAVLRANGSGTTTWQTSGVPFLMAAGQTNAVVAANTYYTITLPTGRFSQAPRIVATATNPTTYGQTIVIADVTTTNFKIASNAACNAVDWIAIQMTSAASSG